VATDEFASPEEGSDSVTLIAASKECGDVGILHVDTSRSNMETAIRGPEHGKNMLLLTSSILAED
jgi:hypothetical protein